MFSFENIKSILSGLVACIKVNVINAPILLENSNNACSILSSVNLGSKYFLYIVKSMQYEDGR
jgi:hypothetical protein